MWDARFRREMVTADYEHVQVCGITLEEGQGHLPSHTRAHAHGDAYTHQGIADGDQAGEHART